MSDFTYSYDSETNKFELYINHNLIYSFVDCEPMTENEAYNMAEDLYTEYLDNTMRFRPNTFFNHI